MADNATLDLYPTGFLTSETMTLKNPNLYSNSAYAHPNVRDQGSNRVVRLMSAYRTNTPTVNSAAFALQVIQAATDKFGEDPVGWFIMQYEHNDFIYDTNLAFLDDTIKFIVSGHRDIGVRAWSDMIIRKPTRKPGSASVSRGTEARKLLKKVFSGPQGRNQLFTNWVGRNEDGVTDLLWTLYILFGQTDLPTGSQ